MNDVLSTYSTDFFVTYSGRDEQWAAWIAAMLESEGYRTTAQLWDFRPGDNFMAAMDRALSESQHTIGVVTPQYVASVFTRAEWTAAYRQTLGGKRRAFIPVRVAECDPPPLLGPVAYIDLVDLDEHEARQALVAGVSDRVPRRTTPPFPGGTRP